MGGAASHHEHELVLDVLSLNGPAFAVNGSRQIVAWNDGAERLLGLQAEQVIGMRCYEALATSAGELCVDCGFRCKPSDGPTRASDASDAADARQSVAAIGAFVSPSHSEPRRVHVTTLAAHTRAGQLRLVHLLHDAPDEPSTPTTASTRSIAALPAPLATQPAPFAPLNESAESGSRQRRPTLLTQRELEVLRLLGAGYSTDDIARELSITRVTARNHVNKVLEKLGVNSRLQAVVIASQLQLI